MSARGGGAPTTAEGPAPSTATIRVAMIYDMDACRGPTGVTRHALAQLERLACRPEVRLSLVSGRMSEADGLAYWEQLGDLPRRELPVRTRNLLRWWRISAWPPLECWTGPVDWVYSPAEFGVATRRARRAVTSHDVLQDLCYNGPWRREWLARTFGRADLILSVSQYNTERLLEAFPDCRDRVVYVPNAADDLFFEPASERERSEARADLGVPDGVPYLLSVANFQPRKNLPRLIRAAARLPEVARGDLALVLLGTGSEEEARPLREAIAAAGPRALIRMPGYRQGASLRAAYAEAAALVFPSGGGAHWASASSMRVRPNSWPGRCSVRRGIRASRRPWPIRPPCPRSAARPAGTSTPRARSRSRRPSATSSIAPTSAPAA